CWSTGADGSIAQKDVTVLPSMSVRPFRSAAACALCSSVTVHTCVPGKFVLHAALAPGSPSVALKLKRPGGDASAPFRTLLDRPGSVVVVEVTGPAHVPSAAQASNVLKRPRKAPQALPFLHFAALLTIDAFTPCPFFLVTQHTAAFGLPQIEDDSHFVMSFRHAFSGMRAVRSAPLRVCVTHFVYFPCF